MQLEGKQTVSDTATTWLPAEARRVPRISALTGLGIYTTRRDTTQMTGSELQIHTDHWLDWVGCEPPSRKAAVVRWRVGGTNG
jgi:hypothetical protein